MTVMRIIPNVAEMTPPPMTRMSQARSSRGQEVRRRRAPRMKILPRSNEKLLYNVNLIIYNPCILSSQYIIFVFSNHPRQILWIFCGASSGSYESSASPGSEIFLRVTLSQNRAELLPQNCVLLRATTFYF